LLSSAASVHAQLITFDVSQATVTISAAAVASLEPLGTPMNRPFLEAYGAADNFLGRVLFSGELPTCALCVTPFETLTVSSPTANISKVRFSSQQSQPGPTIWALFDDLSFTTALAAPPASEALGPSRAAPAPQPARLVRCEGESHELELHRPRSATAPERLVKGATAGVQWARGRSSE
jgi:hypothetical protein